MGRTGERTPWRAMSAGALVGAVLAAVVMLAVLGTAAPVGQAAAPTPAAPTPVAASDDVPRVAVIGDSWAEGIGASGLHGFAVLAAQQLDWDYTVLGVGGSGYVAPGRGSNFADRIRQAVDSEPDVLVVQGSINDHESSPGELTGAALRTLTQLRAEADPDTEIVVLGASETPGYDAGTVEDINGAVAAAAEYVGLEFVDPAEEEWLDADDDRVWADDNHPNDVGHQRIADRLKPVLEDALNP